MSILQLQRSQSSRIEENIQHISEIVEHDIIRHSDNKEFLEVFIDIVMRIINLVEDFFKCTDGSMKKLIVIEIGEIIF